MAATVAQFHANFNAGDLLKGGSIWESPGCRPVVLPALGHFPPFIRIVITSFFCWQKPAKTGKNWQNQRFTPKANKTGPGHVSKTERELSQLAARRLQ
jgi:hypothetical protein